MLKISKTTKASFWYIVSEILRKGILVITIPIFTRLMTTEEYGEYNIFISWMSIIGIFTTLNISSNVCNNGMVKFEDKRDSFISSMQGLITVNTLFAFIILMGFYDEMKRIVNLKRPFLAGILICLLLQTSYNMWATKKKFEFNYKKVIFLSMFIAVVDPAAGLISILHVSNRADARILSHLIVLSCIGVFFYILNLRRGRLFYHAGYWKFAVLFALPLIPHYLSQTLLNQMDRIMIGNMCGAGEAGIYSLACSVGMILQVVNTAINNSLTPWIYSTCRKGEYRNIRGKSNVAVIFVGMLNLFLIIIAPELMKIFVTANYFEAVWMIPPITVSVYFIFIYSLFASIEFYFEESRMMAIVSVAGAIINFILNIFSIRVFGYIAAAYTTLICFFIFCVFHYHVMAGVCRKKSIPIPFDMKFITGFTVAEALMMVIALLLYDKTLYRICILFPIMALVCSVFMRQINR